MPFTTLSFGRIEPTLLVGSYPQTPEDVLFLKGEGITGVLSLQSDEDLSYRAVDWGRFWKFYTSQGFVAVRVPIIDFDPGEVKRNLAEAVDALQQLAAGGRAVYVHCTAGINRSATVVAAYLMRRDGLTRAEAIAKVRAGRPQAGPYEDVLDAWGKALART